MQFLTMVAVIALLGLFTVIGPIYANFDLLELNCPGMLDHCKMFEHTEKEITSSCVDNVCECYKNKNRVKCRPNAAVLNNVITGLCPCPMRYSLCKNGLCYCEANKIPSQNMRQCLDKVVYLGEPCESDQQCQSGDIFAVCNETVSPTERICNCRDGFVNQNQKCLSILADAINCKECDNYDSVECSSTTKHCLCQQTWVGSVETKECLNPAGYGLRCDLDIQCQYDMGMGAICHKQDKQKKGTCICKKPYIEKNIKTNIYRRNMTEVECEPSAGGNASSSHAEKTIAQDEIYQNVIKVVCVMPAGVGDYCYEDENCQHPGLKHESESLHCYMAACRCREGFKYKLNDHCVIRSGYTPHGPHFGYVFLGIVVRILNALFRRISV